MLNKVIKITTDYITLGQLLKLADLIASGGEAKSYLASHHIEVNKTAENRRGRKLRSGDAICFDNNLIITLSK